MQHHSFHQPWALFTLLLLKQPQNKRHIVLKNGGSCTLDSTRWITALLVNQEAGPTNRPGESSIAEHARLLLYAAPRL
jgi:hypothetical protein